MELKEVARRIFLQHWWLILAGVIAGATIGALIGSSANGYRASARMVIDAQDPTVTSESTAIADTVRAIATSPALIERARTSAASSTGEPVRLAAGDIGVVPLGTSGVLSLSVTGRSKAVAAMLANALATEVIRMRLHIADGQVTLDRTKLGTRIASLSLRIAALDRAVASVTRRLAGATGARQAALETELGNLSQQRDFLTQQRGVLQSEQASLISGASNQPTPTIISPATAGEATTAGASFSSKGVLGALLGFVVALIAAALLEAFRPTLVGGEAVARELGKAHLGTFSVDASGQLAAVNGAAITHLLQESARRAGVARVELLGIGSTADLGLIANALDSAVATHALAGPRVAASGYGASSRAITVRPFGLREVAEGTGTGVAIIAPAVLKKSELVDAMPSLRTTPWPLLGIMTYRPTRFHWWDSLVPGHSAVENSEGGAPVGEDAEAMEAG